MHPDSLDAGDFGVRDPTRAHPIHAYLKKIRLDGPIPIPPPPESTTSASYNTSWDDTSFFTTSADLSHGRLRDITDSPITSPLALLKKFKNKSSAVTPPNRPRPRPKGTPHPLRVRPLNQDKSDSREEWSTPSGPLLSKSEFLKVRKRGVFKFYLN